LANFNRERSIQATSSTHSKTIILKVTCDISILTMEKALIEDEPEKEEEIPDDLRYTDEL
jgi:hypothetical protein